MNKEKVDQTKERLRDILSDNVLRMMDHDGMSCYQIQKEHGISARTLYSIINKQRMPSIFIVFRLAEIFEVSVEWLVTEHKLFRGSVTD